MQRRTMSSIVVTSSRRITVRPAVVQNVAEFASQPSQIRGTASCRRSAGRRSLRRSGSAGEDRRADRYSGGLPTPISISQPLITKSQAKFQTKGSRPEGANRCSSATCRSSSERLKTEESTSAMRESAIRPEVRSRRGTRLRLPTLISIRSHEHCVGDHANLRGKRAQQRNVVHHPLSSLFDRPPVRRTLARLGCSAAASTTRRTGVPAHLRELCPSISKQASVRSAGGRSSRPEQWVMNHLPLLARLPLRSR